MDQQELERVLAELKKYLDELNKTIIAIFPDRFKQEQKECQQTHTTKV